MEGVKEDENDECEANAKVQVLKKVLGKRFR